MKPESPTIPVPDHGYVKLLDSMGSDTSIVNCARVSYDGGSKGEEKDKKLLRYLFENKHSSPFEMAKIQFEVKLPIFVARQLVRHRMQNLNEVSARYTELPEEFYVPDELRVQASHSKQASVEGHFDDHCAIQEEIESHCRDAFWLYKSLIARGVAKEQARIVLPLNTYTKWVTCWDLNNFCKLCLLRIHPHAQHETRIYVERMLALAKTRFPWTCELIQEVIDANTQD